MPVFQLTTLFGMLRIYQMKKNPQMNFSGVSSEYSFLHPSNQRESLNLPPYNSIQSVSQGFTTFLSTVRNTDVHCILCSITNKVTNVYFIMQTLQTTVLPPVSNLATWGTRLINCSNYGNKEELCAESGVNFSLIQQSGEYCQYNIRNIFYCVALSGRDYIYLKATFS